MTNNELKKMFAEEEKLLSESHQRTVERHKEIMAAIQSLEKRKKPTVIGVTMSS